MATLPPEIIDNIRSRLPVKSLLRFRCVSKAWCAEIDSPDFINLHLSRSISTASNLSLIAKNGAIFYSLDYDSLETLPKFEIPFYNHKKTMLLNTCNGLLLLQNRDHNNQWKSKGLVLFNPSTRKSILLPNPPLLEKKYVQSARWCVGYDTMNDDFKVVNVIICLDRPMTCGLRVYSLKSNSWHITTDLANEKRFHILERLTAYVNGALHSADDKDPTSLVAFDVGKESFNQIPLPKFRDTKISRVEPHVFDGCLAISCLHSDDHTDIWVMGEYGLKESWCLLLSVKPDIHSSRVVPIVYSKTRTEVLLSYVNCKLVWYDLKKNTVRDFQLNGLSIVNSVVCVGSLVSVASARETDKKAQQGAKRMKEEMVKKKRLEPLD